MSCLSLVWLSITNNVVAGMSVSTPPERAELLDLIEMFQRRVRWPKKSLRRDLEMEYQKDALSGFTG